MQLEIISLNENPLPSKANVSDAGFDLRAAHDVTLPPGGSTSLPTGVKVNMESVGAPCFGLVAPRSGLGSRGLNLANTIGIIDQGYQGEILLKLVNRGSELLEIKKGDRVAQLIVLPLLCPQLRQVEEFSHTTDRGVGGFGSSAVA